MGDETFFVEREVYYVAFYKNDTICSISSKPYYDRDECKTACKKKNDANPGGSGSYCVATEKKNIELTLEL